MGSARIKWGVLVLYLSRSTSLLLSTSSRLRPSYPQRKQKCEIYRHCLSHLSGGAIIKGSIPRPPRPLSLCNAVTSTCHVDVASRGARGSPHWQHLSQLRLR